MSSNAETTQAPRPGSDEVLRELVSLRKDVGATYPRIRKYCSKTMRLPIVDDQIELERTSIHPDDRHIGLHRAIGCVLDNKFHSLRDVAIVVGTLRFDTGHMDFKLAEGHYDERDRLLGHREEALRRFYKLEKTRFDEIRNNAYLLLADELASAERSPCRRGGFTKAFERDLPSADDDDLLGSLSIMKNPIYKEAILNELRLRLSRVGKVPEGSGSEGVIKAIEDAWDYLFPGRKKINRGSRASRSTSQVVFEYKVSHAIVKSASFTFDPDGLMRAMFSDSDAFFDERIARFGEVITGGRNGQQTHSRFPTVEWEVRAAAWAVLLSRLTQTLFSARRTSSSLSTRQTLEDLEALRRNVEAGGPFPIVELRHERYS